MSSCYNHSTHHAADLTPARGGAKEIEFGWRLLQGSRGRAVELHLRQRCPHGSRRCSSPLSHRQSFPGGCTTVSQEFHRGPVLGLPGRWFCAACPCRSSDGAACSGTEQLCWPSCLHTGECFTSIVYSGCIP